MQSCAEAGRVQGTCLTVTSAVYEEERRVGAERMVCVTWHGVARDDSHRVLKLEGDEGEGGRGRFLFCSG